MELMYIYLTVQSKTIVSSYLRLVSWMYLHPSVDIFTSNWVFFSQLNLSSSQTCLLYDPILAFDSNLCELCASCWSYRLIWWVNKDVYTLLDTLRVVFFIYSSIRIHIDHRNKNINILNSLNILKVI